VCGELLSDNKSAFVAQFANMTVQDCVKLAASGGYQYVGLQGDACFGSNDVGKLTVRSSCRLKCPGDESTNCGDTCSKSIWRVLGNGKYRIHRLALNCSSPLL
jgi:hypothetical protein